MTDPSDSVHSKIQEKDLKKTPQNSTSAHTLQISPLLITSKSTEKMYVDSEMQQLFSFRSFLLCLHLTVFCHIH
jgi:hypothetical protein